MKYLVLAVGLLVLGMAGCAKKENTATKIQGIAVAAPTPEPTPSECRFTIAAVGDVMLGRSVQEQMEKRGDWTWPWASVAAILSRADLTIGNLEAAVVPGCYQKENRFILCTRPEARAGLTLAGFDVLSLANNHTLNWGQAGYDESVGLLNEVGIDSVAGEKTAFKDVCGVKVGFIGLDDVSKPLNLSLVKAEVASVAAQSQITIPIIHWGAEYMDQPTGRQREVASALSEAGATVIVGSHPHWVQPAEKVGKTLVFWSLGNMVFDQMWSEETRSGTIAEIRFMINDLRLKAMDYNLIPTKIYNYGQPRIADSD